MLAARLTGVMLSQNVLNGPLVGGVVGSQPYDAERSVLSGWKRHRSRTCLRRFGEMTHRRQRREIEPDTPLRPAAVRQSNRVDSSMSLRFSSRNTTACSSPSYLTTSTWVICPAL